MEKLVKKLPDIKKTEPKHGREKYRDPDRTYKAERAELRALRSLLDKKDATPVWGGLEKIRTPEGHYLWLCQEHAKKYR